MHTLSFGTWFIHISSVLEWIAIIYTICSISIDSKYKKLFWFALAMIPNLIGGMNAITWHIFDNINELYGLVVLQGCFTLIGNISLAIAAYIIYLDQKRKKLI